MANRVDIQLSAEGAAAVKKAFDDLAAASQKFSLGVSQGSHAARQELTSLGSTAKRVFEVFAGVNLATVFERGVVAIKEFLAESSKLGREQRLQEETFRSFAASVGVAGDALADKIQEVAGGIIDSGDAMKVAMRGLSEGLQPQQILTLTDAARQLAKSLQVDAVEAYRDLTEAIATGQSRRLKEIGITIDQEAALKEYATTLGIAVEQLSTADKTQALFLATMQKAAPVIEANRRVNDEFGESMQRLRVQWQNVKETVGVFVNETAIDVLKWLKQVKTDVGDIGPSLQQLGTIWAATWSNAKATLEPFAGLIGGLKGTVSELTEVFAEVGVGANLVFTGLVGPATYFGSILSDIASRRWPDLEAAADRARAATEKATKAWRDSVTSLEALRERLYGGAAAMGGLDEEAARLGIVLGKMGGAADMGRNKLGGLGNQVKALVPDLKALAAEAEKISGAIRGLTDKVALETLLPQESESAGLMASFAEKLANLDNLTAENREGLLAWARSMATTVVNLKAMKDATEEAMTVLRANETASSVQPLLAALKVWSDLAVAVDKASAQFNVDRDAQKLLEETIAETRAALEGLRASFGDTTDDAALMASRLDDALGKLDRLKTVRATAEDVAGAWTFVSESTTDATVALGDFSTELGKAVQQTALLGKGLGDELAVKIVATEQAILKAAAAFGVESDAVKLLQDRLAGFKAQSFDESLASIGRSAALLGPDFDAVAAAIAKTREEMLRLADANGVLDPKVQQLKTRLEGLVEFQKTKDLFADLFGSIQGGIAKMIEGLQLGTRSWKDFGEMALDVLRSIAAEIVNRLIKAALDPLTQRLATIAAAGLSASGSTITRADGTTVSVGVSSPEALAQAGMGGGGFFDGASSSLGFLRNIIDLKSLGSIWQGAVAGWDAGFGGLTGAIDGATSAFAQTSSQISNFGIALNWVAAAIGTIQIAMDQNKTNLGKGIQSATLVAGAALAPYTYGLSTIAAFAINWLEDLFGIFGKVSNYDLKRMKAAQEANDAFASVAGGYSAAARTGDAASILGALRGGGGGAASNSVRTDLLVSSDLAQRLGITGTQQGDMIRAAWADVTQQQFDQLVQIFKENPELIKRSVQGSGDVPYLSGGDAYDVARQIAQAAQGMLTAFVTMEQVRDKIKDVAARLTDTSKDLLPPDVAAAFVSRLVTPIRDRMLAVLSSGLPVDEMQAQLESLEQELRAAAGSVALYGTIEQDIAKLSGDVGTVTQGAVLGIKTILQAADQAVEDAQRRASVAVGGQEVLDANAALREAILNRYQTEMQMVAEIQAQISSLLDTVAAPITEAMTRASVAVLAQTTTYFDELYASLAQMAMAAPTVAQQLFAIGAGLRLVIAGSVPSSEFFRNGADIYSTDARQRWGMLRAMGDTAAAPTTIPEEITANIMAQAAPFLGALADLIETAQAQGDLQGEVALLQQQAAAIQALGAAAIEAVQVWAQSAIDETERLSDAMLTDINTNWDAFQQFIDDTADTQLTALRAWQSGLEASSNFINSLLFGNQFSPLTVSQQVASRQGHFDAAQAAFNANPTGEGLSALVESAQQYLSVALAQVRELADEEIHGIETARDLRIQALNDEIDAVQTAADLQIRALSAQQSALQAQIEEARAWEGVAQSIGDQLQGLRLGPTAPINPADQFKLASSTFDRLLAEFRLAPTAALAGDIQQAANDLLKAGELTTRGKPSPEFQQLFDRVTSALEGVMGTAVELAPVSSADLQAQTDAIGLQIAAVRDHAAAQVALLQEAITNTTTTAQAQIDAVNANATLTSRAITQGVVDIIAAAEAQAPAATPADIQAQIDWWERWKTDQTAEATRGRERDKNLVLDWKIKQIEAINLTAQTTVDGINAGTAAALRANAAEQNRILGLLVGSQLDQLNEITKDQPIQHFMAQKARETVTLLGDIKLDLEHFLASIPQHAEGTWNSRGGVAMLHPGEIVLPRTVSGLIRAGAGLAPAGGKGGVTFAPVVNVYGGGDPALTKALVRQGIQEAYRELRDSAAGKKLGL